MTHALAALSADAVLVGLGLFVVLAIFVRVDPAPGVSFSTAPITDEAYNILNSRNLVMLGRWSTDQWNLYLVHLPFSVFIAGVFELFGVGLVQARLVSIAAVSLTAAALVWALRPLLGRPAALLAGLGFACSGLVLYYGRLVFLEDIVAALLVAAILPLARPDRLGLRWGTVSGVLFGLAILNKPLGGFAAAGVVAVVGAAAVLRLVDRGALRWATGAIAAMAVVGGVWLAVGWLPNRSAVALDLAVWPHERYPQTVGGIVEAVATYLRHGDEISGPLLGPLLWLGAIGVVLVVVGRQRLPFEARPIVLAAIGWLIPTFLVLATASYSPNRYAVVLVPALAVVAGAGLFVALGGIATAADAARGEWLGRGAAKVLTAAALVVAVTPGVALYSGWMSRTTTTRELAAASLFAAVAPHGVRVAGPDAALLLLHSPAVPTITGPANNGDLYALGTRWYLVPEQAAAPTGVPDASWRAARRVACVGWRAGTVCLFHVP